MHLYTAYEAYRAINTGRDVGWGQLTCLLPWHSQHANGLKRWQKSSLRGFGLLGNNAWISSVAWDIVFSGIGICTWSIISASEPRGMIGCKLMCTDILESSLRPWGLCLMTSQAASFLGARTSNKLQPRTMATPQLKNRRCLRLEIVKVVRHSLLLSTCLQYGAVEDWQPFNRHLNYHCRLG